MSLTVNSGQKNTNNPTFFKRACGTGAAIVATKAIDKITPAIAIPIENSWINLNNNATKNETMLLNQAGDKVLSRLTNLSKKGVEIVDASNLPKARKTLFGNSLNGIIEGKSATFIYGRKIPKWMNKLNDKINKKSKKDILKDIVGAGTFESNKVYINRKKMSFALLHELGHADNYNNSGFIKTFAKARGPLQLAVGFLPLVAACTKKEIAPEGGELTKKQKVKNTLRNMLPLASFALMIPSFLDEGIASAKANKWAKNLLNPQMASKVAKSNKIGFASYVVLAAMSAVATHVALKVKDVVVEEQAFGSSKKNGNVKHAHQG